MVGRMAGLLVLVVLMCPAVRGEQYWVAYEENDFPENEGWTRVMSDGGADRALDTGDFVVDSRRSVAIVDYYSVERDIDPAAGDVFMMEWGLTVSQVSAREDPTVVVFSDNWLDGLVGP